MTTTTRLEYNRELIANMNDKVIPHLLKMDTASLLEVSFRLSLLSPIVNNLDATNKLHLEMHHLIGLGCAALQLLAITQHDATTQNIIHSTE